MTEDRRALVTFQVRNVSSKPVRFADPDPENWDHDYPTVYDAGGVTRRTIVVQRVSRETGLPLKNSPGVIGCMSIDAVLKTAALSDLEMIGHRDVPYELWKVLAPGESHVVDLRVPAPPGGEMNVVNVDIKTNTIRFPEE